jgi:hypothetical protein
VSDPNRRLDDGHIIKGETITATGHTEHKLSGCHIETVHFDPLSLQPLLLSIDSSRGLDHVHEIIADRTPSRLIDWFLTGEVKLHFSSKHNSHAGRLTIDRKR